MAETKGYHLIVLVIFAGAWQCTQQASLPSDTHYTAGVVEFHPSIFSENINAYLEIIGSVEAEPTDIIVFPEATLNDNLYASFVPDPNEALIIPCIVDPNAELYQDFLVQLSCQARNVSKYVVVNLTEKENCTTVLNDPRPCASDELNVYNTNVVFDRNGAVVSRYRKVHLYGEPKNTTYLPEYGIFDTDFGVRFGHFVCFDILFYTPAQEMVDAYGIKDYIFPTMWFSQLPFLTGVQFHASWSYGNDVNLLAAGASYPIIGTTGSGIYNGRRGTLVSVMNEGLGERRVYVARVPKYQQNQRLSKRSLKAVKPLGGPSSKAYLNVQLKRDYLEQYESVVLDLSQGTSIVQDLCFADAICCHFELNWRHLTTSPNTTYYTYRLGAYDGWRNEASVDGNTLKNCVIFSCTGATDIFECGKLFNASVDNVEPQVVFDSILIEATFPRVEQYSLMPNSLRADLLPLNANEFVWQETLTDQTHSISFRLNTSTDNLLAFAIYGNYYDGCECKLNDNDDDDDDDGAAVIGLSTFLKLLTPLIVLGSLSCVRYR